MITTKTPVVNWCNLIYVRRLTLCNRYIFNISR